MADMEHHNQVAGTVYRQICTKDGLEVPTVNMRENYNSGGEQKSNDIVGFPNPVWETVDG